jgi:hypothetical protein
MTAQGTTESRECHHQWIYLDVAMTYAEGKTQALIIVQLIEKANDSCSTCARGLIERRASPNTSALRGGIRKFTGRGDIASCVIELPNRNDEADASDSLRHSDVTASILPTAIRPGHGNAAIVAIRCGGAVKAVRVFMLNSLTTVVKKLSSLHVLWLAVRI